MIDLKPGDWCDTQESTPEEFRIMADRFMTALIDNSLSTTFTRKTPSAMGWSSNDEMTLVHAHGMPDCCHGREVSRLEVLSNGWDGVGSPPQGAIVEHFNGHSYERVRVAYASRQTVLLVTMDGLHETITTPRQVVGDVRRITRKPTPPESLMKVEGLCRRLANLFAKAKP